MIFLMLFLLATTNYGHNKLYRHTEIQTDIQTYIQTYRQTSCQMEKPLEGVTVQGPLSWDRREEISLVC